METQKIQPQRNNRFFSLKAKLLVPILGIVFITLAVSTLAVMHTVDKALVSSGKEKILNFTMVVANNISAQINRAKMDMTFAHRVPAIAATIDSTATSSLDDRASFITFPTACWQVWETSAAITRLSIPYPGPA
jgi:hypothetical protein